MSIAEHTFCVKRFLRPGCDAWFCRQATEVAFVVVAEGFSPAGRVMRQPPPLG